MSTHTARVFACAFACLALLGLAPSAPAARPFSPSSVWNAPLPANAPLASNAASLSGALQSQLSLAAPWINTYKWSAPVYTVPAGTPTQAVHIDTPSSMFTNAADAATLQSRLSAVPIPAGARHADGTDQHLVIWQPSSDTMWELWIANHVPDDNDPWGNSIPGWHAAWGARIDHVSQSDGRVPAPFGATASGLPLMGGLITFDDLNAGRIDHALAMAVPQVTPGSFVWPATRTDGRGGQYAIPMGTRFRLDPKLDLSKLALSPMARMVAQAMQTYGVVVRDTAGAVVLYGQDPMPNYLATGVNPYWAVFGSLTPDQILAQIPWGRLQAVSPGYQPRLTATTQPTAIVPSGGSATTTAPTGTKTAPATTTRTRRPSSRTRARSAATRRARCLRHARTHRARARCRHRHQRHRHARRHHRESTRHASHSTRRPRPAGRRAR